MILASRKKNAFTQLFNFEHVQLAYSECSICGDYTMTKTKCKHPLYYGCQEQIKETNFTDEDDDTFATQECPMCRQIINKRQLNVDKLKKINFNKYFTFFIDIFWSAFWRKKRDFVSCILIKSVLIIK